MGSCEGCANRPVLGQLDCNVPDHQLYSRAKMPLAYKVKEDGTPTCFKAPVKEAKE